MGDFNPHAQAECDGGSTIQVDVQAPWNIKQIDVTVIANGEATVFSVMHEVRFDLVDGPWWSVRDAVNTFVASDTASVSAVFVEVDSEGHVFNHYKSGKDVVALPATGCEVTTTSAPSQVTTTTQAGSVPPPTLPTIETTTTVVGAPPHHHGGMLPPTGVAVTPALVGLSLVVAGCVALWRGSKVGAR